MPASIDRVPDRSIGPRSHTCRRWPLDGRARRRARQRMTRRRRRDRLDRTARILRRRARSRRTRARRRARCPRRRSLRRSTRARRHDRPRRRGSFRAANGTRRRAAACDRPGSAAAPRRRSRLHARRDPSCRAPRTPCTPASAPARSRASTPACDRPRAAVPRPSCRRRADNDAASSPARAPWRGAPPPGLLRSFPRRTTVTEHRPGFAERRIERRRLARRAHGARQQFAIGRAAESRALVLQQVCVCQPRVRRRILRAARPSSARTRGRLRSTCAHRANRARAAL